MAKTTVKPQEGFQEKFLTCHADIVIGGGSAGSGKTYAAVLAPLYHIQDPNFKCVVFRRNLTQIKNSGGLWQESQTLYPLFGGKAREQALDWQFKSGAKIKFAHLEYESDRLVWQGSQIALIIFDELTHFTESQVNYLMSRLRGVYKSKPQLLATCNPDSTSFVARWIEWWIGDDGFPIPERDGVLRYFIKNGETWTWGNSKQEVIDAVKDYMPEVTPDFVKSITFISGKLSDNKILMKADPTYIANLFNLPEQEKRELLYGNWNKSASKLGLFDPDYVENMFDNPYPKTSTGRYITCDAARFGADWTVIFVWNGWRVVKCIIFTKNDANMAYLAIERERKTFGIPKNNVIVDGDGVGSGIVKLGTYQSFHGGSQALSVTELRNGVKENYFNRKTQYFYHLADNVNKNNVSLALNNETVVIDSVYGVKLMMNNQLTDIRDVIRKQSRCIEADKIDSDGKLRINTKEAQKLLNGGRSPDLWDALSLRTHYDLTNLSITVSNNNNNYGSHDN